MRPCTEFDPDPLRRPLLIAASDVDERKVQRTRPVNSYTESTENAPEEEPSPTVAHVARSASMYEGTHSWTQAHQSPALGQQQAASKKEFDDSQVVTSPVNSEQHGAISAGRQRSALSEDQGGALLQQMNLNTTATDRTPQDPTREKLTASAEAALLHERDHVRMDLPEECTRASQLPSQNNRTRTPAASFSSPVPSSVSLMAGDPHSEGSTSPWSFLVRLWGTCFTETPRGSCRARRPFRNCTTAFWWLLSPLFLLFTWFCWHGVRALWKMRSGAPGDWFSRDANDSLHDYGLVIDAGSHGSRLSIYSWKPRLFDPTHPFTGPVSFPKLRFNGIPVGALRTPQEVPSILGALIEQGTKFLRLQARVPEPRWSDFPLYLKATGGLRNMEQTPRDKLMATIRNYLQNRELNPFRFERPWARVLAGEEEGVYGWLAVNSERNSLLDDPARTTGALDLGGASAQITFVPTHTSVLEGLTLVRLGDRTIRLYSHSYLGYGWGDALRRVSTGLAVDALLHNIKANSHFIEEHILAGRRFAGVSAGKSSSWVTSARGCSTSTRETANLKVFNLPPAQQDRGLVEVLDSRSGAREGRRGSRAAVESETEESVTPALEKDNCAGAGKASKCSTSTLSKERENQEDGRKQKSAACVEKECYKPAGGHSFADRKRGPALSGNHWKHRAIESTGERGGQRKVELLLTAQSQGDRPRESSTQTSAFGILDLVKTSSEQDASPQEEDGSKRDNLYFPVAPVVLDRRAAVADGKQSGTSVFTEYSRGQTPAVAAASLFSRKGHKVGDDAVTNATSSKATAAAMKPEQQGGASGVDSSDVVNQRHQQEGKKALKGSLSDRKSPRRAKTGRGTGKKGTVREKEAAGVGVTQEMKVLEEEIRDVSGRVLGKEVYARTRPQGASVKADHTLTFDVSHPCFVRGSVHEFPLPALSYPERRYYVDISVDKIATYMRVAGYEEREIESTIRTMNPHALKRHLDKRDVHSNKIHLPTHPQEQHQQQQQQKRQQQRQQSTGEQGRELSAAEGLLWKDDTLQVARDAWVSARGRQQQQQQKQQSVMRRLSGRKAVLTVEESDGPQKAVSPSTVSNNSNQAASISPRTRIETLTADVYRLRQQHLPQNSLAGEEAETDGDADKANHFSAAAAASAPSESSAYVAKINGSDSAAVTAGARALAANHHWGKDSVREGDPTGEELSNAAAGAGSPQLKKSPAKNRSKTSGDKGGAATRAEHWQEERECGARDAEREGEEARTRGGDTGEAEAGGDSYGEEKRHNSEARKPANVGPKIDIVVRFIGTGDFKACEARANKLFHKTLCFVNSCSFNGIYQPRLENSNRQCKASWTRIEAVSTAGAAQSESASGGAAAAIVAADEFLYSFLAFGQYSKVHAAMGLPPHAPLSAFIEGAKKICGQRVGQLRLRRRLEGPSALFYSKKSLEKLCWKSIWSYAVLSEGFGIPPSSTRISFAPIPSSDAAAPSPGWAAGSMIAEVNSYPWEVPPETYEAPFHLATAFLIMSLILAIILYHEVHWMRKRLRETNHWESEGNEEVGTASSTDGAVARNGQEQELQQVGPA